MPAVSAEMTTVEREVVSEARTRVEFLAAEEPDCSSQQLVVRVTKQPTNGKLEVEEGNGFGYWQKESSRAKCGERPISGMLVYYTSRLSVLRATAPCRASSRGPTWSSSRGLSGGELIIVQGLKNLPPRRLAHD
jgi:hypothetical protein